MTEEEKNQYTLTNLNLNVETHQKRICEIDSTITTYQIAISKIDSGLYLGSELHLYRSELNDMILFEQRQREKLVIMLAAIEEHIAQLS